jgi:NAD-dependent dihydropyrimidine dehydrogenase PreA subunit
MANSGLSYCQIMIGRAMTGLIGLQEIFASLEQEGVSEDAPDLGPRLVEALRRHNYVPRNATAMYEAALVREYRQYLAARRSGQTARIWRDPRKEHKPWYPTILAEKCDGCRLCLPVCPHNVLGWDEGQRIVLVLEPYECAPGCELCAKACPRQAIIMPPRAVLYQRVEGSAGTTNPACRGCNQQDCRGCPEAR